MALELTPRQRRWLDALLMLSTIAVAFIVIGFVAAVFNAFSDVILTFFIAWLISFVLTPGTAALESAMPRLHRVASVVVVYGLVLGALLLVTLLAANALVGSIQDFIGSIPRLNQDLPALLAPWQERVNGLGLQVNLVEQAQVLLSNANRYAAQLAGPLQEIAVASLGILGNVLIVVILSLYMTIDRERILSFLYRVVPRGHEEEARLFQTSISRAFGGFLRGQAFLGLVYAAIAATTNLVLNLPFLPITTAAAGILQTIPFFGPFLSWSPPVIVAILFAPEATLPAVILMGIGWFVVMNVLQPRLMSDAVGIHPIVVLGAVVLGSKIAGIAGAIFGIPIAAVLSTFFFYWFSRAREQGPVATRAAMRLEQREGRKVRMPVEPEPGVDEDVVEGDGTAARQKPARETGARETAVDETAVDETGGRQPPVRPAASASLPRRILRRPTPRTPQSGHEGGIGR